MKLKNTIHTLKSGDQVDVEELEMLISRTMKVQMTPSSVSWLCTELSISPPVIMITDESVAGYRQAADSNGVMEEMPADVEDVEVTPSSDQGDTDNIGLEKFIVMDVSADLTCEEMIYLIHKAAKEPNVMKHFTGFISESSNSIFFHFESDSALNAFTVKFTDMDFKTFKEEANTAGRTKIIDDSNFKLIVVHEVPKKSKDLSRRDKGWNWDLLEQTCEFVIRRGGTKGSCHNQSQCVT